MPHLSLYVAVAGQVCAEYNEPHRRLVFEFDQFVVSLILKIEGTTKIAGPRPAGRGNSSAAD